MSGHGPPPRGPGSDEMSTEARPVPATSAEGPQAERSGNRLPVDRLVAGVALILVGGLWFLDAAGVAALRWQVVLPALLTLVGVALLATARREEHGGLIAAGIVLGVLVLATAAPATGLVGGVGERVERPVDVATAEQGFELGVGSLRLDLRDVDGLVDDTAVPVSVGIGEVVVRLPEDVGVQIDANVGIGEATVLGRSQGGLGVALTDEVAGEPVVVLEVSAGIGRVEVVQ